MPPPLLEHHKQDILGVNFMYSHNASYLIICTRKITFITLQTFNTRRVNHTTRRITYARPNKDIITGINKVISMHKNRGFTIDMVYEDNEFAKLKDKIDATVETCAANQHVPTIEREIRTIKEHQRCYWMDLPYKQVPRLMIDNLFEILPWLNQYARKTGISSTMSPGAIVLGTGPIDCRNLKLTFGSYCIVYKETKNNHQPRGIRAIALRPSNSDGGYHFMPLDTGKKIHGFQWTELAISDDVIDRVHELAEEQHAEFLDDDGYPKLGMEPGHNIIVEYGDEGGIAGQDAYEVYTDNEDNGDSEEDSDSSDNKDYAPSKTDSSSSDDMSDGMLDDELDSDKENQRDIEDTQDENAIENGSMEEHADGDLRSKATDEDTNSALDGEDEEVRSNGANDASAGNSNG